MPGGRPKKPEGPAVPVHINGLGQVRIDPTIKSKARYIAAELGVTLGSYLAAIVVPQIEHDFREAMPPYESS